MKRLVFGSPEASHIRGVDKFLEDVTRAREVINSCLTCRGTFEQDEDEHCEDCEVEIEDLRLGTNFEEIKCYIQQPELVRAQIQQAKYALTS